MVQHRGQQPQICVSAWAGPGFVFYYFKSTNKILHDPHTQSAVYLTILAGSYSLMPFAGGSSCNSKTECKTSNKWWKFCSVNHKGEVRVGQQNVVLAKKGDSGSASENHIAP